MWSSTWRFVVENMVPPRCEQAVAQRLCWEKSRLILHCWLPILHTVGSNFQHICSIAPTSSQAQVCVKTKFGQFTLLRNLGPHTSLWSIIPGHWICYVHSFTMFSPSSICGSTCVSQPNISYVSYHICFATHFIFVLPHISYLFCHTFHICFVTHFIFVSFQKR